MDRGSVMERSVAGAAEQSGIKKNKEKIAISSQEGIISILRVELVCRGDVLDRHWAVLSKWG